MTDCFWHSHTSSFRFLSFNSLHKSTYRMYNNLDIVFDPVKNLRNMTKHDGLSLKKAIEFDWESALTWRDERRDYKELRVSAIGYIGLRLFYVVFVDRGEQRRIISLRKANKREEKRYAET